MGQNFQFDQVDGAGQQMHATPSFSYGEHVVSPAGPIAAAKATINASQACMPIMLFPLDCPYSQRRKFI